MKLLLLVWVLCFFVGCEAVSRVESAAPELQSTPPRLNQGDLVKRGAELPKRATLVRASRAEWNISERRLGREDLIDVFFVDAEVGWIAAIKGDTLVPSGGALYTTADGGRNWKRLPLNLPKSSFISEVSFADRSNGRLIVQTIDREATKLQIMETSDGGTTWKSGFSLPKAIARKMLLSMNGEGWIIGIRGEATYVHSRTNLVLHTAGFGKTWQDVTPESASSKDDSSAVLFKDIFTDIVLGDDLQSTAISRDGVVSMTRDGGSTWKIIAKVNISEEHSQGFSQLLKPDNSGFVTVSGANGPDGVWSTFGRYQDGEETKPIFLGLVFVTAIDLYSSKDAIAAGQRYNANDASKPPSSAVIVTTDDFEKWRLQLDVSTGCEFGCKFNAMARRGNGYCIVGSDGIIVIMDRRP